MATNLFEMQWATPVESFSWNRIYHAISLAGTVLVIVTLLNFIFALWRHHRSHKFEELTKGQLPPLYPSLIPHLGPLLQLWWNHSGFVRQVSSYGGKLTANRVAIMGHTYYNFQDRDSVEKLFKQPTLSSSINMYAFVNSHLLGTSQKTMVVYQADNSGPFPQPHTKSDVLPHNRIDYITHRSVFRGLVGPGSQPTTLRFARDVSRRLQELNITEDWTEMSDFAQFFRDIVGASTLQSVLGPTMLDLNPTFVQDMFKFDRMFPTFASGLPRFMMPKAYRFRDGLVGQFKNWYKYAREHFDPSKIDDDGDGDPVWGSDMMRRRQDMLLQVDKHDDEALARVDLGLAWATIGNVVISSMFSAFHIFKDDELLARVRRDIHQYLGQGSMQDVVDLQQFAKDVPLLSAVYAETLRLYIKVYSVYSSPHEDVDLGKWFLPKGALAILNSEPSHMDATFWNTKNEQHPVQSFWADRFLVDPSDPQSGPIGPSGHKPTPGAEKETDGKAYFSTEGLGGAWVPYGGGYSMCPGRFLAKNVITFTSALLAIEYDVELCNDSVKFTKKRYGMGVEDLKDPIPFRIRKRAAADK